MFPNKIENFAGMTAAKIAEYRAAVRDGLKAFQAKMATDRASITEDEAADARWFSEQHMGASKEALAAARDLESLAAQDFADDEDEAADDETEAGDETDDASAEEQGETGETGEGGEADGDASAKGRKLQTAFGAGRPAKGGATTKPRGPARIMRADGSGGEFESWLDVATETAAFAESLRPTSEVNHTIARIPGDYPEDRKLDGKRLLFNQQRFEQDEMTAAMCAPIPPRYELVGDNITRRPVFNSLAQYEAPRGGWAVYPSPSLHDLDTAAGKGIGIWTPANDADPGAVKNGCQTIKCASTEEFRIYGIYRCLTVKNLLALTFPELVEAYLNRLFAAWCRLAEVTLLNAMGNRATLVNAHRLGYGGSVSIVTTILNYIALWMEHERWDAPTMVAWAPRWIRTAMKMDIARRRRDDGNFTLPTDADIDAMLANVGISNVTWSLDIPTWASPLSPVRHGDGTLNRLPSSADFLIAPAGKFGVMDRGGIELGVTGRGVVRDNTSNSKNEFTMWFENFEGAIDVNNLPAHRLRIPACWNGQQIADVALNCEGGDYAGIGS